MRRSEVEVPGYMSAKRRSEANIVEVEKFRAQIAMPPRYVDGSGSSRSNYG